jgi:hypothetical protein
MTFGTGTFQNSNGGEALFFLVPAELPRQNTLCCCFEYTKHLAFHEDWTKLV